MAEFVLVAGAWLGAWAWDDVVPELRAAGHGVHAVTLAGLAERFDDPVGPQTHVRDIVDAVEQLDLRDVVLVGHSYSGIPVGQAGLRIRDRLRRLVFVDANVPTDGVSFVGLWTAVGQEMVTAALPKHHGRWQMMEPGDYEGQGLSRDQIERIMAGSTPHPGASITDPAVLVGPLGELPATYVKCLLNGEQPSDDVAELLRGDAWELVTMKTGHWPMFSEPGELAAVLLDAAGRQPARGNTV
jgi:pimeloyl-ACP methyl ester carboxylesterase